MSAALPPLVADVVTVYVDWLGEPALTGPTTLMAHATPAATMAPKSGTLLVVAEQICWSKVNVYVPTPVRATTHEFWKFTAPPAPMTMLAAPK